MDTELESSRQVVQGHPAVDLKLGLMLLVAVPLVILARGYVFPYPNHGQDIPPIMAMIDPSLFQNDFAVQSFLPPGVRFYCLHLIAFLVGHLGFSISGAYDFLYGLALISFTAGILRIASHVSTVIGIFSKHAQLSLAAVLLFWSVAPLYSWGSAIMSRSALPSTFAMGIVIWGVYFTLKGRWILSYALFGLAAVLQFLVGFLPGLVFAPALLHDTFTRRSRGQVLPAIMLWSAGLAVVYVPMLLTSQPAPADFDFVAIFGQHRFPHHWIPSSANAIEWLSDSALVISTSAFALSLRNSHPAMRRLALLCSSGVLVSTLAVVANYLFVEVWPVTIIGKLQFQRIMPFGHLCAMISLLTLAAALWQKRLYGSLAALIVAPLFMLWGVIVAAVVIAFLSNKAIGRAGQTALLLTLMAISPGLHTTWHVVRGSPVIGAGFSTSIIEAVSYLALFVCLTGTAAFISMPNGRFRRASTAVGLSSLYSMTWLLFNIHAFRKNDVWKCDQACLEKLTTKVSRRWSLNSMSDVPLASLAEALRAHTKPNQMVMLPPCGPFGYFQLVSQRPAYFVHLNVPFTDDGVWLWSERGAKLLGNKLQPFMTANKIELLFSQRSSYELANLAQQEGIHYVVSRKDWHGDMPGTLLSEDTYGKDTWALWRLDGSQSR